MLPEDFDIKFIHAAMPAILIDPRIIQGIGEIGARAVLVGRNAVPQHEIVEAFLVCKFGSCSTVIVV